MQQYLQLVDHVLTHGVDKADRTGTGTRSVFGHQMRFDLAAGFPVLTTKKLHLRSIIGELLQICGMSGESAVAVLAPTSKTPAVPPEVWDERTRERERQKPPAEAGG